MDIIRKAALAVIENGKVLMVRSHKNATKFYTLGGKYEPGEDDIECLTREVKEEVGARIDLKSLKFLHQFHGPAQGKAPNTELIIRLYSGTLLNSPVPSHEIAETRYFDTSAPDEHITEMGRKIFAWLKTYNYIK